MPVAPPQDALDRLSRMTSATAEPVLDSVELSELLQGEEIADAAGLAPDELGWVPTYRYNAAAAAGWLRKAGRAAPNYSFTTDDQQSAQSDVFKHCMAQAQAYSALAAEDAHATGNGQGNYSVSVLGPHAA